MPRDFYPRREADVRAFTGVLAARLAGDWAALGIPEETADEYAATQAAFAELCNASLDPTRRTPSVVAGKRAAARALEAATRPIAARIRCNTAIPMSTKVSLNIVPAKARYTRIARPEVAPKVAVIATGPRSMTVRFAHPDRPWGKALPKGVGLVAVLIAVGETSPNDGGGPWRSYGVSPRATFTINVTDEDLPPFAKVWVTARFANPRGEAGPWATPAWANVPPGLRLAERTRQAGSAAA